MPVRAGRRCDRGERRTRVLAHGLRKTALRTVGRTITWCAAGAVSILGFVHLIVGPGNPYSALVFASREGEVHFKIGDRIERPGDSFGLQCEIVAVHPTGYTWCYVPNNPIADISREHYSSEGTDDPFFRNGWVLASR